MSEESAVVEASEVAEDAAPARDAEEPARLPSMAPSEVAGLVERARDAQRVHAARSLEERCAQLRRFGRLLLRQGERLADAMTADTGVPPAECWMHELLPVADLTRYWTEAGPELLASEETELDPIRHPGKRALVERLPRGIVALITPARFPVALPTRTLFPALLSGNAVVCKPSEHVPRTGRLLAAIAREAFGSDLVTFAGGGADVGAALVRAPVDAVVFTGRSETGRAVAVAAAGRGIPLSLELGGKDAAIVLADADLERSARGILWGALAHGGTSGAGIERVFAAPAQIAPLAKRLATLAEALRPGEDYGPLLSEEQLADVESQVSEAVEAGAELVTGGARLEGEGRFFAPTVLTGVDADARLAREEASGPVLVLFDAADPASAIVAANTTPFGLSASVWGRDLAAAEEVARQLRVGVVTINNHATSRVIPSLPWGGVGESGGGVAGSPHCLDAFTRPRTLVVDARRRRDRSWHPYTAGLVQSTRALVELRSGGAFVRLRAFFRWIGAALRRWKR